MEIMMNTYLKSAEEYNELNRMIGRIQDSSKYKKIGHAYAGNTAIAVECYLKHIYKIIKDGNPEVKGNERLFYMKNGTKHVYFDHNILAIARRISIESENTISFSKELQKDLNKINDFYFMRYPDSKKYKEITKEDIVLCKKALNKIRSLAMKIDREFIENEQTRIDAEKCIEENNEENNLYIK